MMLRFAIMAAWLGISVGKLWSFFAPQLPAELVSPWTGLVLCLFLGGFPLIRLLRGLHVLSYAISNVVLIGGYLYVTGKITF